MNDLVSVAVSFAIVIVALSVPAIFMAVRQFVVASVSARQLEAVAASVRMAVLAVEQIGLSGDEAKASAISIAQESLHKYGIYVDDEYVAMLVEATVKELFNMLRDKA